MPQNNNFWSIKINIPDGIVLVIIILPEFFTQSCWFTKLVEQNVYKIDLVLKVDDTI
jgi:hypothetical protein